MIVSLQIPPIDGLKFMGKDWDYGVSPVRALGGVQLRGTQVVATVRRLCGKAFNLPGTWNRARRAKVKLKRRGFLKSIVPMIWGGKKLVDDLLWESEDEARLVEIVRIDTPTCFSALAYPASWMSYGAIYYDGHPLDEADVEHIAKEFDKAMRERRSQ